MRAALADVETLHSAASQKADPGSAVLLFRKAAPRPRSVSSKFSSASMARWPKVVMVVDWSIRAFSSVATRRETWSSSVCSNDVRVACTDSRISVWRRCAEILHARTDQRDLARIAEPLWRLRRNGIPPEPGGSQDPLFAAEQARPVGRGRRIRCPVPDALPRR